MLIKNVKVLTIPDYDYEPDFDSPDPYDIEHPDPEDEED